MMSNSVRQSRIRLSLMPVILCLLVLSLFDTADAKIKPTGKDIGVVQFDAIIEVNSFSSRYSHALIFARYWVAPDFYSVAVIWAEPHTIDFNFALHPSSLTISSDKESFDVGHELYPRYNNTYDKPIGERDVFRFMFGEYPVGETRFAEQEALATRIYAGDFKGLEDANKPAGEPLEVSIPAADGNRTRDVAKVKVSTNECRIDFLQLFDAKQQLLKSVTYQYDDKGGKTILCRQTVELAERALVVGFRDKGIKVTLAGKEYQYRDLQARHHAGGRKCTVEYEAVPLGEKVTQVPVYVVVHGEQEGRILRSARLMNFKRVDLDAAGARQAARQFGGFTPEQRTYQEIVSKQWQKVSGKDGGQVDANTIKELRADFEKAAAAAGSNLGERLKHLNILMELDLVLGDEGQLERDYEHYLTTLGENKLSEMALVGGYGTIETAMLWNRRTQANRLLSRWVDAAVVINDANSILLFARRQLDKKRFWTTAMLLERVSEKWHFLVDARFEAEALRCVALAELCGLLREPDAVKGMTAKVEIDWVSASVTTDEIEKMLGNSTGQAKVSFAGLAKPTELQQALKRQIDQVEREIAQADK